MGQFADQPFRFHRIGEPSFGKAFFQTGFNDARANDPELDQKIAGRRADNVMVSNQQL